MYSAVFRGPLLGCKGVAFSLHSTCILLYSEVPSMHSAFRPCLWACVFVDFRVCATRPTTLFIILEGERTHGPSFPQTSRPFMALAHQGLGGSCLAAGLSSRILPEHAGPWLAHMLHCAGSWHAQRPCVTTVALKWPSVHGLHTCYIVLVHGMHRGLALPPLP